MPALLLAAALLQGCRPQPVPLLRVAANPWPGYEFLFLAESKGFFVDEGVQVQLLETLSLADTRRAFERNQVDVFAGTVVEVLLSADFSDRKPRVFHVCDYSAGADVILARPPVDSVPALKGKRIGIEPASVNVTLLQLALVKNGLRLEDVVAVPLAQNAMPDAVARNNVDAVVSYPPVSMRLLAAGMTLVFDSTSVPGEVVDVLAADASVLESRRKDIEALVRAYGRAQQFADAHPEEAYAIMARREGISVDEFKAALQGIRLVRVDEQAVELGQGAAVERALQLTAKGLLSIKLLGGAPDLPGLIDYAGVSGVRGNHGSL